MALWKVSFDLLWKQPLEEHNIQPKEERYCTAGRDIIGFFNKMSFLPLYQVQVEHLL